MVVSLRGTGGSLPQTELGLQACTPLPGFWGRMLSWDMLRQRMALTSRFILCYSRRRNTAAEEAHLTGTVREEHGTSELGGTHGSLRSLHLCPCQFLCLEPLPLHHFPSPGECLIFPFLSKAISSRKPP